MVTVASRAFGDGGAGAGWASGGLGLVVLEAGFPSWLRFVRMVVGCDGMVANPALPGPI